MSTPETFPVIELHMVGVERLRKFWLRFVLLGVLLLILGTIAVVASVAVTLATMVFIGWLMLVGGVLQAAHGFTCKEWSGFFIDLLTGLLYLVAGTMIILNPAATAVTLTLLISMLLIFGGIFRIATALSVRFHNASWLLLHGIINIMLGISIWQSWPLSGLWVIGLFVGVDMIFNGWSLIMLGLAAKQMKEVPNAT